MPVLIRRVAEALDVPVYPTIRQPARVSRQRFVKAGELERHVESAARRGGPEGRILILLDADEDCPAELGPKLLERAQSVRSDRLIGVVLAKREYEAWFLAGLDSLRGRRGMRTDAEPLSEPEGIRGAKQRVNQAMQPGRYRERLDQAGFTYCLDLDSARIRSPSLDKMCRVIEELVA